ncbi:MULTISPECIES: NAD(P)H-dependent oxidoreductase [unclassified Bradyrhizobium]|uniref:NAD(P)H-dependent oxidoreductase n=1 Tax=unclassified Bradyrhizobium TaxID=2631580 RepID=UPI003391CD65
MTSWSSQLQCITSPCPAALKAWIDHVVRVRRTFNVTAEGKTGLAARSSGICRSVLGRRIFRRAHASARFSHRPA